MEFDHNQPIYIQIATRIKEQILTGALRTGQKLPSVREYAVIFEVSPLTIHRALQYLELEQVITTKKGIGSFVQEKMLEALTGQLVEGQVRDFVTKMKSYGIREEDAAAMVRDAWRGGKDTE